MKFSLTKKCILITALGALPLLAGFFIKQYLLLFLTYNILVLFLIVIDINLTQDKSAILPQRVHEKYLRMGIDNNIYITVENLSRKPLNLIIRDITPYDIEVKPIIIPCKVDPQRKETVQYIVHPMKRGKFSYGDIYIQAAGLLGLVRKTYKFDATEDVSVYPHLGPMNRYRLIAKHMIKGTGSRRQRIQSIALDFRGVRDYNTDDEYRAINWSASARARKPMINMYDIEKSQNILLCMDTGRTMFDSYQGFSALDRSVAAAMVLSKIADDTGDKAGLLIYSSKIEAFIKPDKGKNHQKKLTDMLFDLQPKHYESNVREMVSYIKNVYKKRSLVCIFTALPYDKDGAYELLSNLSILKKQHGIIIITPTNPGIASIINKSTESENDIFIKGGASKILRQNEAVSRILSAGGVHVISAEPDRLTEDIIAIYMSLRSRVGYS